MRTPQHPKNTSHTPPAAARGSRLAMSLAMLALSAAGVAGGAETEPWPDTYLSRLQAQALIQTINAEILASTSATLSLEKWCGEHAMAAPPKVLAHLQRGLVQPASAEQRARLGAGPDTPIKYRRVQLYCGTHLLSEADNWYLPERLTPDMNRQLEESDTPFGKVVLTLQPYRRTYAAKSLWSPLPEHWETGAAQTLAPSSSPVMRPPAALFQHSAVLYTREHLPFSEVHEVYQRGILEFAAPAAPAP